MNKPVIQLLLIEDSQTDALLLEDALRQDVLNLFVFTMADRLELGEEALRKQEFDLVLLDLGLPDSQGFESFEKLHQVNPDTPVIVLSGLADEKLALEAVQAGAQDYLVKGPTSWEIAPRAIRYAIERRRAQAALRESEEQYRLLFENAPVGILSVTVDGKITDVNTTALQILGSPSVEATKKINLLEFSSLIEVGISSDFQACIESNQTISAECSYSTKWNKSIFVKYHLTPVLNAAGKIVLVQLIIEDISERKQAEERLNQSENRYQLATKATNDVIWEWNANSHQLIWTENVQDAFGYLPDEIGPNEKWWDEHIHPDDRERVLSELDILLGGDGSIWSEEYRFLLRDGSYAYISDHGYVERDTDGEPVRMIGAMSNVTERKRTEIALRESEERFATVFHASPMSIAVTRLSDNCLIDVNEAWQRLTGFTREEAIGHTTFELNVWADLAQREQLIKLLRNEEAVHDFEFQIRKKSGEISDLLFSGVEIEVANEKYLLSMALDITDRKHAEVALQESEQRFRSLYNNATIGLYRTTPDGHILMANPAAVRLLGFESFNELAQRNLEEDGFEPDYLRQEFREKLEREGKVVGLESVWTRKDGKPIFVRESATVIRDNQGKILYYDGTFEDITARKQAEAALRESEEKYRLLVESATIGIVIAQDQRLKYINPKAMELVGYSKEELLSLDFVERIHPDDRDETIGYYLKFLQGEETPTNHVFRILDKVGGTKWIDSNAVLINWEGRPASLNFLMEITKRKLAEEALRQHLAELETLYESGLILSQITYPQRIAQKLIDLMVEKMGWLHLTIRRYHPEDGSLELLAFSHPDISSAKVRKTIEKRFQSMITKIDEGLSGWVVQHGKVVRSGNLSQNPHYLAVVPGLHSGLYVPMKIGNQIMGVISIESELLEAFSEADERLVTTLATQAAVTFDNIQLFEDLQTSNDRLFQAYDKTIEGWSNALDLRDKETEGHTQRVTTLTDELAHEIGIPKTEIVHIRRGALLHDIGKMGVPDRILLKPDKLTDEEWVIMRQHPVYAYNLLSPIEFLNPALNIPRYHHEKWDGSGYPDGLKGKQIPLDARIFAVADVFDALTSDRPYRPGWARDKAISYIQEQSGSHFDPKVVKAFMKLVNGK